MKPAKKEIIDKFMSTGVQTVLDLGAGDCECSAYMAKHGCDVTAMDINFRDERVPGSYRCIIGDVGHAPIEACDGILSSHCLEHLIDPLAALKGWRNLLRPDGFLCLIVPPYVTRVVGRHIFAGWNIGNLMLTLFRSGFNIKDGMFLQKDYNVAAIVQKDKLTHLEMNDEVLIEHKDKFPPSIRQQIENNIMTNSWGEEISFYEGGIRNLNWRQDEKSDTDNA